MMIRLSSGGNSGKLQKVEGITFLSLIDTYFVSQVTLVSYSILSYKLGRDASNPES